MELERDLQAGGGVLAVRVQVDVVPLQPGVARHEAAGLRVEGEAARIVPQVVDGRPVAVVELIAVLVDQREERVVVDEPAADGPCVVADLLDLHRLHVAVLAQPGLDRRQRAPPVGIVRRTRRRRSHDHQVGVAHLPRPGTREGERRRQMVRVAARGAAVHPGADCRDLLLGQGHVVLDGLDADVLLQEPGRHHAHAVAERRAVLDAPRPRADLFVGHQRHRRQRVGAMTALAALLQDRRDVLREGHRLVACSLTGRQGRGREQQRQHWNDTEQSVAGAGHEAVLPGNTRRIPDGSADAGGRGAAPSD